MPMETKIVAREDCLQPHPELVFRKEEEGAFLFDPATGNLKYLNAGGVNIYELCDGRKTVGEIIAFLTASYPEVAGGQIAADTESFCAELVAMNFLIKSECHGS